jgi:hypothetical protein
MMKGSGRIYWNVQKLRLRRRDAYHESKLDAMRGC